MLWSQSYVSHCRVLPLGEFNGMSSQSHVSHCRVLPLDKFTVMIPEPHATLQGVRILFAILKIVFRHILFIYLFLMQFGLWRAAAFVSSPIHLFTYATTADKFVIPKQCCSVISVSISTYLFYWEQYYQYTNVKLWWVGIKRVDFFAARCDA